MTERAVLLWIHGGGWRGRADEDGAALAAHGLRVVRGTYRLVDEAHWPAQLDDVRAAARSARDGGGLPLLVGGDSAGATWPCRWGCAASTGRATWRACWRTGRRSTRWRRSGGGCAPHDDPWAGLLGHPPAPGDRRRSTRPSPRTSATGVPVLLVHGSGDQSRAGRPVARPHRARCWPPGIRCTPGSPTAGTPSTLDRPDLRAVAAAFLDTVLPAR